MLSRLPGSATSKLLICSGKSEIKNSIDIIASHRTLFLFCHGGEMGQKKHYAPNPWRAHSRPPMLYLRSRIRRPPRT
jgi:hypothetical protein